MVILLSGLLEAIGGTEDIARFLTQSSHFSSIAVKPSVFLPRAHETEVSVSRHGEHPAATLWKLGRSAAGKRKLYGAAIFKADAARDAGLDVVSDEPPPFHALLTEWPSEADDLVLQKAKRKEIALQLVSAAGRPRLC